MKDDKTRAWTPEDRRVYALFDYIYYPHLDKMRALLDEGVSPKSEKHHESALTYAASRGSVEAVRVLLEYGAGDFGDDPDEELPMIDAACGGEPETIHIFLSLGGDPNQRDGRGWTPLMEAAYWGYPEVCRALIEGGADVNAVTSGGGFTALGVAEREGHAEVAELLRKAGANRREGGGAP